MVWPLRNSDKEAAAKALLEAIPDDLKDKSPEELAALLRQAQNATSDLAALKTGKETSDAELLSLNATIDELKTQIEALKVAQQTPPSERNDQRRGPVSVLEDEDAAFAQRNAPLANAVAATNVKLGRSEAISRIRTNEVDARLLSKYQSEIDKMFNSIPIQFQNDPEGTYVGCFERVTGQHRQDIANMRGTSDDPFVEPASGGGALPVSKPADKLNDDEAAIAKKMGISPEAYLKNRKGMTVVTA